LAYRVEFADYFLEKCKEDPYFPSKVIRTDESGFKLDGKGNIQNTRFWSKQNPDFTVEKKLKSPTLNVWGGIWGGAIIGPFFFESTVTGERYLKMLEETIWPSLQQIPNLEEMLWMQDGAPPHWMLGVKEWLNSHFPGRWIGRDGPILWPPRSPDFTPMDFSVWGTVKNRCYASKPRNMNQLKEVIIEEFSKLDVAYCQKTCQHVMKRMESCKLLGGAQVERPLQIN
jgi:hypothetical protein